MQVGQQVKRGQELGLLGTSGNSTMPHLHFQVLTQPTFFPSDSPRSSSTRFELTGQITQRVWDDILGLHPTGTLPFEAADPRWEADRPDAARPGSGARVRQLMRRRR